MLVNELRRWVMEAELNTRLTDKEIVVELTGNQEIRNDVQFKRH